MRPLQGGQRPFSSEDRVVIWSSGSHSQQAFLFSNVSCRSDEFAGSAVAVS